MPTLPETKTTPGAFTRFDHPVALQVLIAFLRTGRLIDHASSVLLIIMFLMALRTPSIFLTVAMSFSVLFALAEKYYAWRVGLDAELFTIFREFPGDAQVFDESLAVFLGRESKGKLRSMESRWKGARRLFCGQVICVVLQIVMVLGCMGYWGLGRAFLV